MPIKQNQLQLNIKYLIINQYIKLILGYGNNIANRDNPQPSPSLMGVIYLVTSPSGKQYIGQHHTEDLKKRKNTHFLSYKKFIRKKLLLEIENQHGSEHTKTPKGGYCVALFNAFAKHVHLHPLHSLEIKLKRRLNSF